MTTIVALISSNRMLTTITYYLMSLILWQWISSLVMLIDTILRLMHYTGSRKAALCILIMGKGMSDICI